MFKSSGVTRGRGGPPSEGDTRTEKIVDKLTKNVDKRGRRGKKGCGMTPFRGGWHPSEINKSDSDWLWWAKKVVSFLRRRGDTAELADGERSSVFSRKNRVDTLSCRPGWHQPNEATVQVSLLSFLSEENLCSLYTDRCEKTTERNNVTNACNTSISNPRRLA